MAEDSGSSRSSGSTRSRVSVGSGSTANKSARSAAPHDDEHDAQSLAPKTRRSASAARQALLHNSRVWSQAAREAAKASQFMTTWSSTLRGAGISIALSSLAFGTVAGAALPGKATH